MAKKKNKKIKEKKLN